MDSPVWHAKLIQSRTTETIGGIWIPGLPVQQGNIAFGRHGKGYHKEKGLEAWRYNIGWRARKMMRTNGFGNVLFGGPIALTLLFVMPRTKAMSKHKATEPHMQRPDLDKLARAAGDALTEVVYLDDSQIIEEHHYKHRAEVNGETGLWLRVERVTKLGDWEDDS